MTDLVAVKQFIVVTKTSDNENSAHRASISKIIETAHAIRFNLLVKSL